MTARLTADKIVAAVLLAVMLTWLVLSLQLEFFVEGKPGPGFFPVWLAALGTAMTAWTLLSDFLQARKRVPEVTTAVEDTSAALDPTAVEGAVVDATREGVAVEEHDRGELWRPVGAFAALFAFFLLQPILGFQVGLLLLLLFICFALIKMPWRVALTVCIGTSLFIYGIFDVLFGVPFTTGIFGI